MISVCRAYGETVVEGCHLKNASGYGIWGMSGQEILIKTNYIHDCTSAGIHVEGTSSLRMEGNHVDSCHTGVFATDTTVLKILNNARIYVWHYMSMTYANRQIFDMVSTSTWLEWYFA